MRNVSRKRHIAKAITYRFLGSIDTFLLSWFISGDATTGLKISSAEVATKMVLYYFHERIWFNADFEKYGDRDSRKRHIYKTFSWRFIGTLDTMLLAWIISGDPMVGLKVGILEVFTKMIIYYLHERVWYRIDYGLPGRKNSRKLNNG